MFKLNRSIVVGPSRERQRLWDESAVSYYKSVDWALDISEAEFGFGPDLHSIPGALIRRDTDTQALFTRQQAIKALQSRDIWGESSLRVAAERFVSEGIFDDVVLVAATQSRYFAQDLEVIQRLRTEGLAN